MRLSSLIIIIALTLGGCAGYKPSEANCFSFVSRDPDKSDCEFIPLENAMPTPDGRVQ